MGDKIATVVFWLVAGTLAAFLVFASGAEGLRSLDLWLIAAGVFGAIVLALGVRQCLQILRGKRDQSS